MKKSHFRILLFIVVLLMAFTSVSTAFAAPPKFFTFHNEGSFEIDCSSFTINEDYLQDGRVTTFYNKAGDPTSMLVHVDENRLLTNLSTGATLNAPGHFSFTVDLQTGVAKEVGVVFRGVIPGQGIVVLDAGKIVVDADGNLTFVAGHPKPSLIVDGETVLCAALS